MTNAKENIKMWAMRERGSQKKKKKKRQMRLLVWMNRRGLIKNSLKKESAAHNHLINNITLNSKWVEIPLKVLSMCKAKNRVIWSYTIKI